MTVEDGGYKPVWMLAEETSALLDQTEYTLPTAGLTKEEILRARGKALVHRQAKHLSEESIEIVQFLLGTESYGIELEYFRRVCPLLDVTYIPHAPKYVVGVINMRGLVIPILDLMSFLDVEVDRINVFNKAIVLQQGKLTVGFLADEVVGAVKIPVKQVQTYMPGLGARTSECLRGVTKDRLLILDGKKLLNDPRLNPESDPDSEFDEEQF